MILSKQCTVTHQLSCKGGEKLKGFNSGLSESLIQVRPTRHSMIGAQVLGLFSHLHISPRAKLRTGGLTPRGRVQPVYCSERRGGKAPPHY
eukprot:522117-Rhodomonas_salina.2